MHPRLARYAIAGLSALTWVALAAAFLLISWPHVVALRLPDPDDNLRLAQVRDWLNGAGWYDTLQRRINPPEGAPMHWSRLVDAPLAAGILALDPWVGRAWAERLSAAIIPLLTFGLIACGAARATARLVGPAWAPVAVVYVGLGTLIYNQTMPMRIDHHGWQLVAAVAAYVALLDEDRPRLSGAVAGIACALWTHISLEGLPMTVAMGALLGVRWILDARAWTRLAAFLITLTACALMLRMLMVAPGQAMSVMCDQISGPHLSALCVACAVLIGLAPATARLAPSPLVRLACAGAAAAAGGVTFLAGAGACLTGPFAAIDPLVKAFWLDHVGESKALIASRPLEILANAGVGASGLIGAVWAVRQSSQAPGAQRQWVSAATLGAVSLGLCLFAMVRMGAVAQAFAPPGAIFLLRELVVRARAVKAPALRVPATLAAALATGPLLFIPEALQAGGRTSGRAGVHTDCFSGPGWEALQAAPAARVLAPLDIGPHLIVHSAHSVPATGHHRNHAAMSLVIRAFLEPPAGARALSIARGYGYVAICPGFPEAELLAAKGPEGLMSQLLAGRPPDWLAPIADGDPARGEMLVWRVAPDAAPTPPVPQTSP